MSDRIDLDSMVMAGRMVIGMQSASLNKINRWLRNPRSAYAHTKYKREIQQWVMVAKCNTRIPAATAKRVLRVMRTYKSERYKLDHDNFVGGCKSLIDALIHQGVILGDESHRVVVVYAQEKQTTGDDDWMEVCVYDYPGEEGGDETERN